MIFLRQLWSNFSGYKIWIFLGIGLLSSLLGACTPDPNDLFIQGNWYFNDPHLLSVVGETYSETFWNFDRGTYETYACCFVKFQQFGRYDILESEGNKLILEMFNTNGKFNSERFQIGIRIDRQEGTITIGPTGPFTRTMP
jgi:hypothetical protein